MKCLSDRLTASQTPVRHTFLMSESRRAASKDFKNRASDISRVGQSVRVRQGLNKLPFHCSHIGFCHFSQVQLSAEPRMPSLRGCPKAWALIPISMIQCTETEALYTPLELLVGWSNSSRNSHRPHLSKAEIGGLCLTISLTFRKRQCNNHTHFTPWLANCAEGLASLNLSFFILYPTIPINYHVQWGAARWMLSRTDSRKMDTNIHNIAPSPSVTACFSLGLPVWKIFVSFVFSNITQSFDNTTLKADQGGVWCSQEKRWQAFRPTFDPSDLVRQTSSFQASWTS